MHSPSAAWLPRAIIGAMLLAGALLLFNPVGPGFNFRAFFEGGGDSSQSEAGNDIQVVIPPFALKERSGQAVTNQELLGKVWIAGFVFTRCTGPCPAVSATMARLQKDFADSPDVRLVTFTVDPEHDDPGELRRYANRFNADPRRWLFLTGEEEKIHGLLRNGFMVPVEKNQGAARTPGNEVMHSTRLAVVDRKGRLRGFASGVQNVEMGETDEAFEANLGRLRDKVAALLAEAP